MIITLPPIIQHHYSIYELLLHLVMCLFFVGYTWYAYIVQNAHFTNLYKRRGLFLYCAGGIFALGKLVYSLCFSQYGVWIYHGLMAISILALIYGSFYLFLSAYARGIMFRITLVAISLGALSKSVIAAYQQNYILNEVKMAMVSPTPLEALRHLSKSENKLWSDMSPEFEDAILFLTADSHAKLGEYRVSLTELDEIKTAHGCEAYIQGIYAYNYFHLGELEKAQKAIEDAVNKNQGNKSLLSLKKEILAKKPVGMRYSDHVGRK